MTVHGIIGKVIGVTQYFHEDGTADTVTAIQAGPCTVTQVKTAEIDGYESVQLGFETAKKSNSPRKGHLAKSGGQSFRFLREVSADDVGVYSLGDEVGVGIFEKGDHILIKDENQSKAFEVAVKSQQAALNVLGPGTTAEQVHAAYAEAVQSAGYPYPTFRCGRATGFSMLEEPQLVVGNKTVLQLSLIHI